jgi:hypothetical protein
LDLRLTSASRLTNLRRGYGTRFAAVGAAAMSIHSFINPGAFEPETIVLMSEAFDAACVELQDTGQPQIVLEVIAERIIAAARNGERDPVRLREAGLAGMPRERD